jgi:PAS domain S-box-containing protein
MYSRVVVAVALRGGDEDVLARVREALEGTEYTIEEPASVVIACSFEATASVREEFPSAAIIALLPDTLEVRRAFALRDVLDSVVPISMLTRDRLVHSIARAISRREARAKQVLVDLASDGMALVSPAGIVLYVNPAGERILGRAASEIVGGPATIFTHPEPPGESPHAGETSTRLARSLLDDGTHRWLESIVRDCTADPEVGAYVITFRDVTARRRAAEKLERSETNFRSLIESSPVATFVHRNRAIVYANHACAAMLGYERPEELLGMDGMELVHPADREIVGGHNERTAAARQTTSTEIRLVRKDGSIVMVEGHGVLLDFDGVPSHVIMNRDVTERRMLFERAAAAERMRAVGALAAGVAHEIKAPLGFVSNALELLARADLSEEERRALIADATTGTHQMASIADSLRTMSHAREETFAHVDVALSMKLALKMLGPELRGRIAVVERYETNLPRVRAQSNRLGQVFVNLILNAAQAMPRGEIRIDAASKGTSVVIEVSDDGPGISAAVRDRIFEPFFTTKPSGKGTGLGLSISRSIVASFGGTLVLGDTPSGASFTITLPAAPSVSKLRILLVDDDPAFVKTLRIMLESDHDVLGTTDAPEALAMITNGERFDAILCDMTMPLMSGLQFHARVGEVASDQARRIVFISGAADAGLDRVGHARLAKPFKPEELTSVLATLR